MNFNGKLVKLPKLDGRTWGQMPRQLHLRKQGMQQRISQAEQLLIQEAHSRANQREDHDRVAALHAAYIELGLRLAQRMADWRAEQREEGV